MVSASWYPAGAATPRDTDGDGIPDVVEGTVPDGDGLPNILDPDVDDGDGIPDVIDGDCDGQPNYVDRD